MKAFDCRQHARYCRDLATHTPPGEPREQLLEIAKTWETLAVERPEWGQQYLELAPGEHQDEDALTGRGPISSRRATKHSSTPPNP